MKLIVERNDLLNGIIAVSRAVAAKSHMPILGCILLEVSDHALYLSATDLNLSIKTSPIEIGSLEDGSVALDGKLFLEIVKKLPDGDLQISVNKDFVTTITSGKCKFSISGLNPDDFPAVAQVEQKNSLSINGATLRKMILQTIFSVAVDDSKPICTGELIQIEDGIMSVVAVDGYRISLRNAVVEDISENIKVVVPANALTEVARLSPGSDDYMIPVCFSDRFIRFELETCIVVSNVLNGEYINYKKSLSAESEATTKIVVDRNELLHSLDCACLVAVESGKRIPVKFVISSGALSITSNTEKGTVSDEIAITCEGKDLTIAFNPRYLIDALKAIEDSTVSFHFTSPTSPCVIRPVEDGNYKYLILPLRQSK